MIGKRWRGRLIAGSVLAYLGVVLVVPLAALVAEALDAGLGAIGAALVAPDALKALGLSLGLAAAAVVLNGAFGVAGALVVVRHRFIGRRVLDAAVDASLAVSPVMTGLAFLLVFGRQGWLGTTLDTLHLRVAFALPGLVLATLFVTLPFTVREVAYVLEEIGTEDEEAAITLGASAWNAFRRVTLPNIRHGLRLGIVLTAARALGEFGAVLVVGGGIGGRTETATTFIFTSVDERRPAAALGMALALGAVSLLLLVALEQVKRRRSAT